MFFSHYYDRDSLPELRRLADECRTRYRHHIVCDDDIPFEQDGWRDNAIWRARMQGMVLHDLAVREIPYVIVGGGLRSRVARFVRCSTARPGSRRSSTNHGTWALGADLVAHAGDGSVARTIERPCRNPCERSALTVDGDLEGGTDLAHPAVAQPPDAVDEHGDRDALDRVEVDGAETGHRIVGRIEHDLARQPADRGRARRDECATQPGIAASRDRTTTGRRPICGNSHHQISPRSGVGISSPQQPRGTTRDRPIVGLVDRHIVVGAVGIVDLRGAMSQQQRSQRLIDDGGIGLAGQGRPRRGQQVLVDRRAHPHSAHTHHHATNMPR